MTSPSQEAIGVMRDFVRRLSDEDSTSRSTKDAPSPMSARSIRVLAADDNNDFFDDSAQRYPSDESKIYPSLSLDDYVPTGHQCARTPSHVI